MRNYSGWIIAGVICLILITLAVTGIVSFGNTTPTTPPQNSTAVVNFLEESTQNLLSVPHRMLA